MFTFVRRRRRIRRRNAALPDARPSLNMKRDSPGAGGRRARRLLRQQTVEGRIVTAEQSRAPAPSVRSPVRPLNKAFNHIALASVGFGVDF